MGMRPVPCFASIDDDSGYFSHTLKARVLPPFSRPTYDSSIPGTTSGPGSCGGMDPSSPFSPSHPCQPLPKSPVSADIPALSFFTNEILTIGNSACSCYEAVRLLRPSEEAQLLQSNPFLTLSRQDIEQYFAAVIDAKNALQLRNAVVAFDIQYLLESLLPKLNLYEKDNAVLESAFEDITLIREACSDMKLPIDFYGLEYARYTCSTPGQSFLEQHRQLFSSTERRLAEHDDAQQTARQFLNDPAAFRECRFRGLFTFQR